jgi:hypothetical protein
MSSGCLLPVWLQDDAERDVEVWLRRKFEGRIRQVEVVLREDLDLVRGGSSSSSSRQQQQQQQKLAAASSSSSIRQQQQQQQLQKQLRMPAVVEFT